MQGGKYNWQHLEAEDRERQGLLAVLGDEACQCPGCGFVIVKNGGDHQMMCGCEAKPAGGTMEKALRGGGCGHQFDFRNGNPLGEGKMGEPVNERQWKFIPRNQRANPDRYLIRMAEQRDRQQRDIAEQARRKNEEERVKREQAAKRKVKNAAAEKCCMTKRR